MKVFLTVCLACVGLMLAACSKEPDVRVYMYSEYIDPELLTQFQKETGLTVEVLTYENSEDMLAKMRQGGGTRQFDVVVVSDVVVPTMVQAGLVAPLDKAKIPNAANVAEDFRDPPFDRGSRYSLPYQWGTVGLMYRKDKFAADPAKLSWAMVLEPDKQPGAFVLMDSMRDMLGVALRYQGKDMNTTSPQDLRAAGELLLKAKKTAHFRGFEGGVGGKNKVLKGDVAAAIVYNGDAIKGIAEAGKGGELAFAVPAEGGVIWTDVMLLSAGAPHPENGLRFINFILDGGNGAKLSNFNRYATPNRASLPQINPEDRDNSQMYPPADARKRLEYLHDLGKATQLYDEVWTAVKAR